MCYNNFSEYFDPTCLYIFMKKFEFEFDTIMGYVDNLNIIETYEELPKVVKYLKKEFEVKIFKIIIIIIIIKFCLDL